VRYEFRQKKIKKNKVTAAVAAEKINGSKIHPIGKAIINI